MPTNAQDLSGLPKGLTAKQPLDRDSLAMLPRGLAAEAAQLALFQVQSLSDQPKGPERIVLGVATLFAAMCLRCGLDASAVHSMGLKVLRSPAEMGSAADVSLQVLRDYSGAALMGQQVTIA